MSTVGSTTGTSGSSSSSSGTTGADAFSSMSSADFLKVMFSELQQQDPTQPQDTSKLLEQLSSLRNVQSQLSLQSTLQSLVLQNQVSSAANMIGKTVTGLDDSNNKLSGVVSSILVQDNKALLQLADGSSLDMSRVTSIANVTN